MNNKSLLNMIKPKYFLTYLVLLVFAFLGFRENPTLGMVEFCVVILLIAGQKLLSIGKKTKK